MSTTDTDALTERIRDEVYGTWISSCCDGAVIDIDEAAEIAADLVPIIAAEVRKAKAEALRETADWWAANPDDDAFETDGDTRNWLRDVATEYETGDSDEHR